MPQMPTRYQQTLIDFNRRRVRNVCPLLIALAVCACLVHHPLQCSWLLQCHCEGLSAWGVGHH